MAPHNVSNYQEQEIEGLALGFEGGMQGIDDNGT